MAAGGGAARRRGSLCPAVDPAAEEPAQGVVDPHGGRRGSHTEQITCIRCAVGGFPVIASATMRQDREWEATGPLGIASGPAPGLTLAADAAGGAVMGPGNALVVDTAVRSKVVSVRWSAGHFSLSVKDQPAVSNTGAIGDDGTRAEEGPEAASFRFWFLTRRWEWSLEFYRMLGYTPGTVEPAIELLVSHHHRDDPDAVVAKLTRALEDGTPFSGRHRLLDTSGAVHEVMVVADRITDDTGTAVGTSGFYLDLTATLAAHARDALTATMPGVMAARAVIEQAKGVLMRMYRINAEQAFKVLTWRSQETNTKIRDLAAQLVADLDELPRPAESVVTEFDHLLLTAHTRIRPPAEATDSAS